MKRATKKDILKVLWKYGYGDWKNGELPEWCYEMADDYPTFLAQVLLDHYIMEKRIILLNSYGKQKHSK